MALEPRFNFDFNTTAIDNAANMKAQRQMQNIASKEAQRATVGDFIKVAGEGAKVYNSIQAAEAVSQSNETKKAYNNTLIQPDYVKGNDTQKHEIVQNFLNEYIKKGGAYQIAAEALIAPTLDRQYKRAKAESVRSGVALAYTGFQTYMQTPIEITDSKGVVTTMTNREAGRTVKDFNNEFVSFFPFLEGSRPDINLMIASGQHRDLLASIEDSKTPEELQEAIEDGKDAAIELADNTMLNSNNKKIKTAFNQAVKQKDRAIAAKKKEFKAAALTGVELNKQEANPNPLQRFKARPNKEIYAAAFGDKWEQEYAKDTHKFEKYEDARDLEYTFKVETDNDWGALTPLQKETAQVLVDQRLLGLFKSGELSQAASVLKRQGSADIKRTAKLSQAIKVSLSNPEETEGAVAQLRALHFKDPAAFNILFPDVKERVQIFALDAISQTLGLDTHAAWLYMKGNPDNPALGLTPNQKTEMGKMYTGDLSSLMKQDIHGMYNVLSTYGLQYSDVKDIIDKYVDSNPYELDLVKEVGSNVADLAQPHVDKFRELNGGTGIAYVNKGDGSIRIENADGVVVNMTDMAGLIKHSTSVENIQKYQDEHWFMRWGEGALDTISTFIATPISYQLTRAGALATSINHAFMTKITTDGEFGKRTNLTDKLWLGTQTTDKRSKSPHVRPEPFDVSNIDWSNVTEKGEK